MSYPKQLFSLKLGILLTCFLCAHIECLLVIPERANLTVMNKKYFTNGFLNVRRYSRRSPYYLNMWGTSLTTLANNISVDFIFSEYLHNEYRRSFIELHYKLCDLINKEPYVGGMFKKAHLVCPLPPGDHYFMNMTAPVDHFPNVFPFEKGRVDGTVSITETKEIILQGYAVLTFKQ